jgi:alkyl hydroperoxide reductase subunit AhpC
MGQSSRINTRMKNIGEKLGPFAVNAIKPNESSPNGRKLVTETTLKGLWKIVVFYPEDFSYVFPEELLNFNKITQELAKNGVTLLIGSVNPDFSTKAWQSISTNMTPTMWLFSDNIQSPKLSLSENLGVDIKSKRALRTLCIVDDEDTIQYVSEDNLDIVNSVSEMMYKLKQAFGSIKS